MRDQQIDTELAAAIEAAIEEALERRRKESLDVAELEYFMPRGLGATAPHDCATWDVDYRASCDDGDEPLDRRRLDDEDITEQIERLLDAGRGFARSLAYKTP